MNAPSERMGGYLLFPKPGGEIGEVIRDTLRRGTTVKIPEKADFLAKNYDFTRCADSELYLISVHGEDLDLHTVSDKKAFRFAPADYEHDAPTANRG